MIPSGRVSGVQTRPCRAGPHIHLPYVAFEHVSIVFLIYRHVCDYIAEYASTFRPYTSINDIYSYPSTTSYGTRTYESYLSPKSAISADEKNDLFAWIDGQTI